MICLFNRCCSWNLHFDARTYKQESKWLVQHVDIYLLHMQHKLYPQCWFSVSSISCFSSGIPIRWMPLVSSLQFYSSKLTYSLHLFFKVNLLIYSSSCRVFSYRHFVQAQDYWIMKIAKGFQTLPEGKKKKSHSCIFCSRSHSWAAADSQPQLILQSESSL